MPEHDAFLSYNWVDREAVETVASELATRNFRIFLDRWYLTPGDSWRRELEEKLGQSACAVIFLGSGGLGNWQERELDFALDRQARDSDFAVIPVLLPGADPPLGFLSMNTWVDDMRDGVRGPAIDALDAAIRGHPLGDESRSSATVLASDVAPYRDLQPFREEDADFFYGREAFTQTLAETVSRQTFVAVVGPSGSGKSSVVHAGLVPRLRAARDGNVWEVATLVPGERPLSALAAALIGLLEPDLSERLAQIGRVAKGLASGTIELADIVARVLEQQPGTDRLLLVVDQWEELYTLTTEDAERRSFIDALVAATEGQSPLTVVLTLRGDFVGTALGYRPLSDRLQGAQVNLSTMTPEEIERAMTEPARKVGLGFEAGLVKRILDDIGDEPGTLPLLEFVLAELWRDRARGLLRHLLLHLVQPGAGTTDTRRRATFEEIGAELEPIVRQLIGSRLLVAGRDETSGKETVEVAHEALIQHWGRLREWVDRDREFLMWRRRIESSLDDWMATGKDEGSLLRGVALAEAQRWHAERADDLGPAEREFVERSAALRKKELARGRRRGRLLVGAAMAVIAAVSALAFVAVVQWQSAQSARSEAEASLATAESRAIAALARVEEDTNPQLALLLAAESYQRSPTLESVAAIDSARDAWIGTWGTFGDPLPGYEDWGVWGVAYSPDGAILASAGDDHTVRLWDVATRQPIGEPLTGHEERVNSVAFSPDGAILASAGGDVRL
ncbi:MAG TPA: TIR domain-containing protein [Dehalococcoidia bacterium]|nr:TIR domain-containing protein [Dehalococcoidia bacterium]